MEGNISLFVITVTKMDSNGVNAAPGGSKEVNQASPEAKNARPYAQVVREGRRSCAPKKVKKRESSAEKA